MHNALERLLLLTQSGVPTRELHLTRVMDEREKNPERKSIWKNAKERFDQAYAQGPPKALDLKKLTIKLDESTLTGNIGSRISPSRR